jgi:hypothetical protein
VREDAQSVRQVTQGLLEANIPVWVDVDDLVGGSRWRDEIRKAIYSGRAFIAFFSTTSEQREKSYMREELVEAIGQLRLRPRDRPWFIPVRLEPCALPDVSIGAGETLSDLHYIDVFDAADSRAIERLVHAVRAASKPT